MTAPSALDDYQFDLRGYLVLPGALSAQEVADLNAAYDRFPTLARSEWYGNAQRRDYTVDTGLEGERRVIILRYGPPWGATRFGYRWSPELLDRLTPARRHVLQPIAPVLPGDPRIPTDLGYSRSAARETS